MFDPAIFGHQAIRQRLLERLEGGKLSGSLLFVGPAGIGKRRVAMELAQRELCFRRNACGQCAGCQLLQTEPLPLELPNLLRIVPEGKAGLIKIGTVRGDDLVEGGVIRWAHQASMANAHRWIVLEDAHRLNGASANMLLKILEEPPSGTHFLLVTHRPEMMLQTIRSRCERISFQPLKATEAWAIAKAAGWEAADEARWTALSAGTLRYLEAETFQRAEAQLQAWLAIAAGATIAEASESLLPDKTSDTAQSEQMAQCLELLLRLLSDVARLREGRKPELASWQSELEAVASTPLELKAPLDAIHTALRHLARNPFAESILREVALTLRS